MSWLDDEWAENFANAVLTICFFVALHWMSGAGPS